MIITYCQPNSVHGSTPPTEFGDGTSMKLAKLSFAVLMVVPIFMALVPVYPDYAPLRFMNIGDQRRLSHL
jgi:hypothetical protein